MRYVIDTGFFIIARDFYMEIFPSFWEKLDVAAYNEDFSSVEEVRREIEEYGGKQEQLIAWIKEHKKLFTSPTIEEQEKVREILAAKEGFHTLLSKKQQMRPGPFADPFIIAKAIVTESVVVTRELPNTKTDRNGKIQGNYKIPNVCAHYGVDCITPEQFMHNEGWRF